MANIVTLGEISSSISYGYTASANFEGGRTKILRITDIVSKPINWASVPYCDISDKDYARNKLEIGDIVIARTGNTVGSNAIIKDNVDSIYASYLIRFKINRDIANPFFVYYVLQSPLFNKFISNIRSKSAQPGANSIELSEFSFILPDLPTQNLIANFLSKLDEKIELNINISAELESLAKTIYDYWFLQFEFPNEEGKPYKSSGGKMIWSEELKREIPEGWGVEEIGKHITVKRGISYNTSDLDDAGIPMLNLNSINPDYSYKVSGLKRYVGTYKAENLLQPHDLVVAVTQQTSIDLVSDTDVIGKGVLVPDIFDGNVVFSMDIIKLVTDEKLDKYYLNMLFKQYFYRRYITGFANGTKIKHLDINGILDFKFIIPENSILRKYSAFAESCECKKSSLLKENLELTELRDYLLPMLMNGQVGFKE